MDSNHAFSVQSAASYQIDDEGMRAGGGSGPAGHPQRRARLAQEGTVGRNRIGIRASSGVLSPLR